MTFLHAPTRMNHLQILFLVASLLAIAAPVHAQSAPAASFGHAIVGTWSWVTFGGTCTETWQFRHNRTLLSTSGQEVAEKKYDIAATADANGFYKLVETVERQNDKKDCAGAMLEGPGDQTTRFVQFSPRGDKMLVCQAAALTACFGPLQRVP